MFRVESSRANLAPRAEFNVKDDVYDDVRFVHDDVEGIVGNIKSIQEQQVDQISIYTLNQTYYGKYKTVEQIDHLIPCISTDSPGEQAPLVHSLLALPLFTRHTFRVTDEANSWRRFTFSKCWTDVQEDARAAVAV